MNNIQFPSDPQNGMIFEAIPGIFYKYNAGSNCWARLKGVDSLGLATPLADGLMSKEDFNKLQGLVLPPPQASLSGEDCDTTFTAGTVALNSLDESLEISKNLKTYNQGVLDSETPWQLHHNTAGFDFKIPINRLLQEIQSRDLLKEIQVQGDKGPKGQRGEAGADRLDTGPVGPAGEDGLNSPFAGVLSEEPIPFETSNANNRAIVDVSIEEVSDGENYLVATRANIGNPDACPALVTPKDFNSALIVALNTLQNGKLIKDQVVSSTDCSLICRVCASSVHHLNIQDILDLIFEQFVIRVNRLKYEKEKLVKAWLGTMVSLFNEQKAALCCALENCRSRGRNQTTRQYIETQRIQAALGDFQLIVDGEDDRQYTDMDGHKNCPVPAETTPSVTTEGDCTLVSLDSKIHISDPRVNSAQSVTTFFPRGTYVVEITTCCANFNASFNSPRYSARAAILYQADITLENATSVEESVESNVITFPDFGSFENVSAARNAYEGLTLTFEHAGGDVSFWLLDADNFVANNDGIVTLTIKDASTLEPDPTLEEANGFLYVYRDEISFNGLLGRITPYSGSLSASENFGSLPGEVDLTHGPALLQDRAQVFFYDGSDGLSLYFVAGEQAGAGVTQVANISVDIEVTNNTNALEVRASDTETDVRRVSASQFEGSLEVNADSAGFAIGEFDPMAEYSVRVEPTDLNTMRTFVAASADGSDLLIAEGGSAGIGSAIAYDQPNSAPISGVTGIPTAYGGGNTTGLRLNNQESGQNVTFTRPISLNIPATVGDVELIIQDLASGSQFALVDADGNITPAPGYDQFLDIENADVSVESASEPDPNLIIKTSGFVDQDFQGPWQEAVRTAGEGGTSSSTRRTQNGNPGAYRETSHNPSTEQRVLANAYRPTAAYYGPGSAPAIKWEQFFAEDQFGNTWLAIRDTNEDTSRGVTGQRPRDDGANAIFLRDATEADIAGQLGLDFRLASAVLGGASGVTPNSLSASWTGNAVPAYGSSISTYHLQTNNTFTPAQSGAINGLSFSVDARLFAGASFNVGPVVAQNGAIYRGPSISVSSNDWTNRSQSGLTSSSFSIVNGDGTLGVETPDFTTTGATITLGYYVSSTHTSGDDVKTIGIDNWNIDIGAECIIQPPTPDTDEKSEISTAASSLPRGTPGAPQDPCIVDVCTALKSSAPQSLRYIFTDSSGNKYYSAYRSINVEDLDEFQFLSFGPVVSVIAPPAEFTPTVISSQNLDLSTVSSKLSTEQLRKAESLDGIARLTYVQELIGTPVELIPNGRAMTDIEIEFRSMPFSTVDFGYISVKVGIPGSTVEIIIDNFPLETQVENESGTTTAFIKRVVATQTGSDSSSSGLIYSGFDSYYGDYSAADGNPNFDGNNFILLNQSLQRLSHVNARTGFQNVVSTTGAILTTNGGTVYGPDAIAVDDFGVVYIADGPAGRVDAWLAANATLANSEYGDIAGGTDSAAQGLPGNFVYALNGIPLPQTSEATIAIGRYKMIGPSMANDIIANFGGQFYRMDSVQRLLFQNGLAFRSDITTPRCCFGGASPGPSRTIANGPPTQNTVALGTSPVGTSLTTSAPANPQPSLPVSSNNINQAVVDAVQAQLDDEFNQFNFYSLDSGSVYEVDPQTGSRTLVQELGENAFSLRVHPRTGDIYYIVDNRGTDPVSGTIIRRLDIDDLDELSRPSIKTVWSSENNEGIFGITFGNSVPSDPTVQNQVLYALLSTLDQQDSGQTVQVRIVEIAEQSTPPVSGPISTEIPINSVWNTSINGGRPLGNPTRIIFSRLVPGGGCQMFHKQVQWYERGWRIGACCGALVEVGGVHYIVVKRSIGTDTSCGGGESLTTSCIRQFIDIGEGHPAIAWPTLPPDLVPGGAGDEFLGLPTSGFVNFVKDETLSEQLLTAIRSGSALKTFGNPASEIPFILFPAA